MPSIHWIYWLSADWEK